MLTQPGIYVVYFLRNRRRLWRLSTSYGTIVHYVDSRFSSAVGTVSVQLIL